MGMYAYCVRCGKGLNKPTINEMAYGSPCSNCGNEQPYPNLHLSKDGINTEFAKALSNSSLSHFTLDQIVDLIEEIKFFKEKLERYSQRLKILERQKES